MKLEELVREQVRTEIKEQVATGTDDDIIEESFINELKDIIGEITNMAGAGVAGVGAIVGAASIGFINPILLGGAFVVGAGVSNIVNILISKTITGRKYLTRDTSIMLSIDLRNLIEERDRILEKFIEKEQKGFDTSKLERKLKKLTNQQKKISVHLEESAEKDFKREDINKKEYKAIMAMTKKGKEGKLSYLAKK